MSYADVNGQSLYYEDSGGTGPAVIFSHGFLMDHEMFAPQIEALAGSFRCITWDQRGFGKTGGIPKPFTYWDSARDCLGILSHLGIEQATLVGMSQGGFLSLRAALLASRSVKALALIDTRSGTDSQETKAAFHNIRTEWLANGPANVQEGLAGFLLGSSYDPKPWFEKWAKMPKEAIAPTIDVLLDRDDITDRLNEITCPVLIFHGDADVAIAPEHGYALHTALTNSAGFVSVPGAGHTANLTHPEHVNGPLAEFLHKYA
jgi:pimeloyl-ACP methyl ester carboxylesterase